MWCIVINLDMEGLGVFLAEAGLESTRLLLLSNESMALSMSLVSILFPRANLHEQGMKGSWL